MLLFASFSLRALDFTPLEYRLHFPNQEWSAAGGSKINLSESDLTFDPPKELQATQSGKIPRGPDKFSDIWKPWPKSLVLLPKADTVIGGALYKSVLPSSVRVTLGKGEAMKLGDDFLFDPDWGTIINKDDRLGKPGSGKLKVQYTYRLQRLDLIQCNAQGQLSVVKGVEAMVCPELPQPKADHHAVAGVYIAPFHDQKGLLAEDVYPILRAKLALPEPNPELQTKLKQLMVPDQKVKFAFIGDSVTVGAEAGLWWENQGFSWRERVFNTLTHEFKSKCEMIEGYHGGRTSESIAPDADKAFSQKPNLTFICLGLNDTNGPTKPKVAPDEYHKNMEALVQKGLDCGSTVVLISPFRPFKSFKNHERMSSYVEKLRTVAKDKGVVLVDVLTMWDQLPQMGYPDYSLLHNWINHPGIKGHEFIARCVLSVMGLNREELPLKANEASLHVTKVTPWQEQVKTKIVEQPHLITGEWAFTPQPHPPAAQIVAQQPDDVPLYGCYSWYGEYKQFRAEIKKIGWKTYRLSGPVDEEVLKMAIEDGIEVMATLQIGKTLQDLKALAKRDRYKSDEDFIEKYIAELDVFCGRFGPGGNIFKENPHLPNNPVKYVEIWNEPNFQYMIPDRPDMKVVMAERDALYGKLLKASYSAIKAKHPDIQVVAFAAGGAAFDDKRFINNVHELYPDIGQYYDILSTHPYTNTPGPSDRIKSWGSFSVAKGWVAIQEILKKHQLKKDLWYTEVGWSIDSKDGGTFKVHGGSTIPLPAMLQAACVIRHYTQSLRLGVKRVHVMSMCDADNFNSGFVLRKNGEWRPVAYATQTMIQLMPQPRLVGVISEDPTSCLYAYEIKSNWKQEASPHVIVVWNGQAKGEISLPLPEGKSVERMVNMLGGELSYDIVDQSVVFEAGPYPSYVVLK